MSISIGAEHVRRLVGREKATMKQMSSIYVFALLCVLPAFPQAGDSSARLQRSVAEIIANFQKPHWDERAAALEDLLKMPGVLRQPAVRAALVSLQEKENAYLNVSDPVTVGDIPHGESYADPYETDLMGALRICAERFNEPGAVAALAAAPYNPDSTFAGWIADQKEAIPRLLQMVQHGSSVDSGNAARVLATAIDRDRHAGTKGFRGYQVMDESTRKQALALIRMSLADIHPYKRDQIISSLELVGDQSDVERLKAIAQTDPSVNKGRFLQREHASRAAAQLQSRLR